MKRTTDFISPSDRPLRMDIQRIRLQQTLNRAVVFHMAH